MPSEPIDSGPKFVDHRGRPIETSDEKSDTTMTQDTDDPGDLGELLDETVPAPLLDARLSVQLSYLIDELDYSVEAVSALYDIPIEGVYSLADRGKYSRLAEEDQ